MSDTHVLAFVEVIWQFLSDITELSEKDPHPPLLSLFSMRQS